MIDEFGIAHIGYVVDDFDATMDQLAAAGIAWSGVVEPMAKLRLPGGQIETRLVRYVVSRQGPGRIKLLESAPGSYWGPVGGRRIVHHLSYWVDDLEQSTADLISGGYRVEADGLAADDSVRYRYLSDGHGLRFELGLRANEAEFEDWATA